MRRSVGRRVGPFWIAAIVACCLVGCASNSAGDSLRSDAAGADSSNADTTTASTAPTTADPPPPDYEAIYRQLHTEAVAYWMDPLNQPSDALNCVRNPNCIRAKEQAREGTSWQGIGPDNITITSVEVLEEISPDLISLKVEVAAEDLIELIDANGEVLQSIGVPTGAASRVDMVKADDRWVLTGAMDGRSWDRSSYEAATAFSMSDPLDEPMTPTGDEGVTDDGVSWRTLTTEDRFCLEATKLPIGKLVRCLSAPKASSKNALNTYTMRFSGSSLAQEYISIWFGIGSEVGIFIMEDGTEEAIEMFPVDASAVFDADVELMLGVGALDARPATVLARGSGEESEGFTFDWPTPEE